RYAFLSKGPADLFTRQARQHEVEQDEILRRISCAVQACRSVGGAFDLIAFRLQITFQSFQNGSIVFDDENLVHEFMTPLDSDSRLGRGYPAVRDWGLGMGREN